MKTFNVVRVVSRNFLSDLWAWGQNLAGKNLTPYEKMFKRGIDECWDEIERLGVTPVWYRVQVTQLGNGALAIVVYGEAA